MSSLLSRSRSKSMDYKPLASEGNGYRSIVDRRKGNATVERLAFGFLLIIVLVGVFLGGRYTSQHSRRDIIGLRSAPRVLEYDQLFADRPNLTTNKAWLDLFPVLGGFFTHPKIAPQRSTFAVFHQLHCLDGMRHGYWSLYDIVLQGKAVNESDLFHHASASHFMHCVDLLRQILMCQPDLTIEVQDAKVGGVGGFGTEHVCVDWKQLVDWTSEREMDGQDKNIGEYDDERENAFPPIHTNTGM